MTVGNSQTSFETVAQHGFAEGPPDGHHQAGRVGPRADPKIRSLDPARAFSVHSRISAHTLTLPGVCALCAGDVRSLARLAVEDVVAKVGGVGRGVDCGRQWCVS